MKYYDEYDSPIGRLIIASYEDKICNIEFENRIKNAIKKKTEVIKKAEKELLEYFEGKRKSFDLPLYIEGTNFQKAVWKELEKIPYGEMCSYEDIAIRIKNPKAVRAVGMANHNNKIAIVIPCHRVIGKNGKLTGYAGGCDKKQYLLDLERKNKTC